jgi:hypothetical protein
VGLVDGRPFTAIGFDVLESSTTQVSSLVFNNFIHPTGSIGFWFPTTPIQFADLVRNATNISTDDGRPLIVDNMVFKTVPVPEPSTLLLFGGAFALLQAVR